MALVAAFTDYGILNPNWFVSKIQEKLNDRDLSGLTNNTIQSIKVTHEHPLANLLTAALNGEKVRYDIIPAISVVESDENETTKMLGQGYLGEQLIEYSWFEDYVEKYVTQKERQEHGLITDTQLAAIGTAFDNTESGKLLLKTYKYYLDESCFVGLWCGSKHERQILGNVLRSIIYDLKKDMIEAGLMDITIRTDKGLINTNFGRTLYGQETEITFKNSFRNFSIYSEEPLDLTAVDVKTFGEYENGEDSIENYEREEVET